jgi:hypothetical protein
MQKTIRSVDATVRIVDESVVMLKNRCTKTIWRQEIPITRGMSTIYEIVEELA